MSRNPAGVRVAVGGIRVGVGVDVNVGVAVGGTGVEVGVWVGVDVAVGFGAMLRTLHPLKNNRSMMEMSKTLKNEWHDIGLFLSCITSKPNDTQEQLSRPAQKSLDSVKDTHLDNQIGTDKHVSNHLIRDDSFYLVCILLTLPNSIASWLFIFIWNDDFCTLFNFQNIATLTRTSSPG